MTGGRNRAWILGLFVALALTNRYEDPAQPTFTGPGDVYAYVTLAQSAPGLPYTHPPRDLFAFHHAQRLAIPYVLGLIHDAVPVPIHRLFQAAVVVSGLAILLLFARMLDDLAVGRRQAGIVLAVLALNPWAFRPYLTFPEMVADLGFVLGLAILLRGLLSGNPAALLVGQLVASLSRQTGLLIVPMVVWWLWRDRTTWGGIARSERLTLGLTTLVLAAGVYAGTGHVAARFAGDDVNAVHILGIGEWMASEFDLAVLAAFLLRAAAAALIPLAFFLALVRRWRAHREHSDCFPLLLFVSICIAAQPLLGGPDITAGNGPRLVTLGLLPLCLALAIKLRDAGVFVDTGGVRPLPLIVALLALASLHHFYVVAAVPSFGDKALFAVTYAAAATGCFLITALEARNRADAPLQAT